MTEEESTEPVPLMQRTATRRAVLGGTLAAGSGAVAYAALGGNLSGGAAPSATEPTGAAPAPLTEAQKIGHLLRRAGFGVSQEEFEHYSEIGLEETVAELVNYDQIDDGEALELASRFPIEPGQRGTPPIWWLTRMANTRRPLQEKMTLFWHGLLTSQISEVRDPTAMVRQNELFRSNALGYFPDLLKEIARDPAMMVYLNIAGSSRFAPNENYARELMELFALGEGNYGEDDVREASRAFTGWAIPRQRLDDNVFQLGEPVFRRRLYDGEPKTFLGETGDLGPDDIVDIIVRQSAASPFIVRRLFNFFIFLNPEPEDLAPFVDVYDRSGRQVGAVVESMLRSDIFYSQRAYRALLKSPIEYGIGAVKALGAQSMTFETIARAGVGRDGGTFAQMGQIPFEPPNVAGWPFGAGWLNSSTIFARVNFMNEITGGGETRAPVGDRRRGRIPAAPAPQTLQMPELPTTDQALSHLLPLLVDDNVSAETRSVLESYAGGSEAQISEERLRGLVYLLLASPEFQLA